MPREFCTPGRRVRLNPDDYFPLGKDRGGIDERWLSSAIRADNGPLTGPFEGLSLVVDPDGEVAELLAALRPLLDRELPELRRVMTEAGIPWPAGDAPVLPAGLLPPFVP